MTRTRAIWGIAAALYLLFTVWYTGCAGPLTPQEIGHYLEQVKGADLEPARLAALRSFLERDTGDDFVMANFIRFRDEPLEAEGVRAGESAREVLDRYMAFMFPALLARACHPVLGGPALGAAVEAWGLENGADWSLAGLIRYRSRRDMMEIVTDPRFSDSHRYKIAAIAKTIAFPMKPVIQLGDPRVLLALLLFSLAAGLQLLLRRRGPQA